LVADFRELGAVEVRLAGYDACFYCAGVSSVGMSEADYTVATYDTPVAFATTLARLNPDMVFVHVTGARTDGTEQGRVMWARVKGKAENALMRLGFRARPGRGPGHRGPGEDLKAPHCKIPRSPWRSRGRHPMPRRSALGLFETAEVGCD
jgi:hypothetical protein